MLINEVAKQCGDFTAQDVEIIKRIVLITREMEFSI